MCIIILGLYYMIYIWIDTRLSMLPIEFDLYNHKIHIILKFFQNCKCGVEDMMWVTQAIWTLKSFTWILTTCILREGWGCKLAFALRRFSLVD